MRRIYRNSIFAPPQTSGKGEAPPTVNSGFIKKIADLASIRQIAGIVFLVALGVVSLGLRLWPLQIAHWWEETAYLQNAEALFFGKTNYSELDFRAPLLSVLFGLSFRLWHNVLAASLAVAFLNTIGVLFLAAAARLLYGLVAGVIAGLLLGLSPFFGESGRTLIPDHPSLSLLAVALYFAISGSKKNALWRFAMAGIFLAAAGLTRFAALLPIPLVCLLFWRGPRDRRGVGTMAAAFALCFLPYLLWLQIRFGSPWIPFQKASEQASGLFGSSWFYLRGFAEVFSWIVAAGLCLWLLACLIRPGFARVGDGWTPIFRLLPRGQDLRTDLVLLSWIVLLPCLFTVASYGELRYLALVAPPVFLLAARGWARLLQVRNTAGKVSVGLLLAGVLAWYSVPSLARFQQSFLNVQITDEMAAASLLGRLERMPQTVLYVTRNFPVFGYYTDLPIRVLKPFDATLEKSFVDHMPEDGYVVLYKQESELRLEWAASDPHFRPIREFPSLLIYGYASP